jgi:hypothetical protein
MIAHAVADNQADRDLFRNALVLEADWGLGRNPMNIIQMTAATTSLESKRSFVNIYTSGRDDGSPGMHPGHTPYMNVDDWWCDMVMGCPSWLHSKGYPSDFSVWPHAEAYFSTRYVYAHSEFTPKQTMRGKMALYGYLYGIGTPWTGTRAPRNDGKPTLRRECVRLTVGGRTLSLPGTGVYTIRIVDLSGRAVWREVRRIDRATTVRVGAVRKSNGLRVLCIDGKGGLSVRQTYLTLK